MIDLIDETLDQVALLVQMQIILTRLLAVFARRNDRFSFFICNPLQKWIRIIRTIRNDALEVKPFDQCFCLSDVMPLTSGQQKTQRIAEGIHVYMNFVAEPAPTASQGLGGLPAVFLALQPHKDGPAPRCCQGAGSPYLDPR
jgi:hypothetical protein